VHAVRVGVTGKGTTRRGISLRTPARLPPLLPAPLDGGRARPNVLLIVTESVRADALCSDPPPVCRGRFLDHVAGDRRPGHLSHQAPPPRPRGRLLPLRHAASIKEEILARPTFFEHFDGVCLDWSYLHEREKAALQSEHGWLKRQGVRLVVDLSSGVDLYPTLRLMDNLHEDYTNSLAAIKDVLGKMDALGAADLMLSLHPNRWQMLKYLEIPSALPILFGGLRIGATLSVIGAVVGEFVGSDQGLGFLINVGRGQYDMPLVFVAIFSLIFLALCLYSIALMAERLSMPWKRHR